jgi:hypothetical protein
MKGTEGPRKRGIVIGGSDRSHAAAQAERRAQRFTCLIEPSCSSSHHRYVMQRGYSHYIP